MEEKIVDLRKFKLEEKKRKAKEKISNAFNTVKEWTSEHPTETVALITGVLSAGVGLAKRHDRRKSMQEVKDLKDLYIYDRSFGGYLKTRRPRTANENAEIARRKRNGEPLDLILRDMRLL